MKICGRVDHLFLSVMPYRIMLDDDRSYAIPESIDPITLAIDCLRLARTAKVPVTIEIDNTNTARAASMRIEGYFISFTLPDGRPIISELRPGFVRLLHYLFLRHTVRARRAIDAPLQSCLHRFGRKNTGPPRQST